MRLLHVALLIALSLPLGCAHERTGADVLAEQAEAFDALVGRIAKIEATVRTMPDLREDELQLTGRVTPRFEAPSAPPGNALTLTWEGLSDLSVLAIDPLGLGRRDALHQLISYVRTGQDLDGHKFLPPDTLDAWFHHVLAAEYLLLVRTEVHEKPSWIEDTLIPGRAAGWVRLFDLQAGRPLGGYRFDVRSIAPEGSRPSAEALGANLRREAVEAIRGGLVALAPDARPPFGDLLHR